MRNMLRVLLVVALGCAVTAGVLSASGSSGAAVPAGGSAETQTPAVNAMAAYAGQAATFGALRSDATPSNASLTWMANKMADALRFKDPAADPRPDLLRAVSGEPEASSALFPTAQGICLVVWAAGIGSGLCKTTQDAAVHGLGVLLHGSDGYSVVGVLADGSTDPSIVDSAGVVVPAVSNDQEGFRVTTPDPPSSLAFRTPSGAVANLRLPDQTHTSPRVGVTSGAAG